jgi:DNA-binding response OmpR family regulator
MWLWAGRPDGRPLGSARAALISARPGVKVSEAHRCRVLIVEDDRDQGRLLSELLTDEGLEVRVVATGRAGLRALAEWGPRLVLLDLMLPDMQGPAFREEQMKMDGARDVPVILLSATHAKNIRQYVHVLDAAAGFEKPFDVEELLGAVARLCESG